MPVKFKRDEFIPTQKAELKERINLFLDEHMEQLFNDFIVDEIRVLAAAANMPKSFIDGVKFIKDAKNQGRIVNTWGTKEKPLAIWFNYGTAQHWIEPLTKDGVLAFGNTQGRNASAIFFQGESKKGDTMFSKGHYVSGVPRTEAMEIGYRVGSARLAQEAAKLTEEVLETDG